MQLRTRRIKLNKGPNKIEKFLAFYFLFLIFIGSIFNLLQNKSYYNLWTIGEWLINYQGGYVGRGLFGSIIYKLSYTFSINPIVIIHVSTLLFFVSFFIFTKRFKKILFNCIFIITDCKPCSIVRRLFSKKRCQWNSCLCYLYKI